LVPDDVRNETARIIEPELRARIDKLKTLIDAGAFDTESAGNGIIHIFQKFVMDAKMWLLDERQKTSCPFALYLQLNPVPVAESVMREIEDELQNPTGIRTLPPPKISINGLFLSKECGIFYELTDTEGIRFVRFAFSFFPYNLACLSSHSFFRKVTACKSSYPKYLLPLPRSS
jgi:hypothetical protein